LCDVGCEFILGFTTLFFRVCFFVHLQPSSSSSSSASLIRARAKQQPIRQCKCSPEGEPSRNSIQELGRKPSQTKTASHNKPILHDDGTAASTITTTSKVHSQDFQQGDLRKNGFDDDNNFGQRQ
jgi:hypothetical protein